MSELWWSADPAGGVTKSVGSLSAEQNGGHAQPGRVGHEREAVLRWDRDQGLGGGLLCSAETMSGGSTQVSYELTFCGRAHEQRKLHNDGHNSEAWPGGTVLL